jgi:hypothetical protein
MIYNEVPGEGYKRIKRIALAFVDAMKTGGEPGVYKKEAIETSPSSYGSYHGAHIMDMFGELEKLGSPQIDAWAELITSRQCGNGYFSNKAADKDRPRILHEMDPVWHFTRGMIWSLRVLDRKPKKDFAFMEPFLKKDVLYKYIKEYDWKNSWAAGNQICALCTALFALRDWYGVPYVDELLESSVYPALEELLDEKTGYWGCQLGADLYNGMFGTIHVLPMYFTQGWNYRFLEQSVDSTLSCQYPDGSFWPCGSDCPDFDGAYMLYNLYQLTDYKKEEIRKAARLYLSHALMHIPSDETGFLIHRRDSKPENWVSRPHFIWEEGKSTATEELRDEDPGRSKIMLGSWFYPLSIALVSGILGDSSYEGPYKLTRTSLHECNVPG